MNFIPRVFEFLSVISFWQSNSIVINKLALLSKRRHIWYFAYRQYYIDLFIYRFVFLYCFLVFNLSIILQRIQFSPSNIYIYIHICIYAWKLYIYIYAYMRRSFHKQHTLEILTFSYQIDFEPLVMHLLREVSLLFILVWISHWLSIPRA